MDFNFLYVSHVNGKINEKTNFQFEYPVASGILKSPWNDGCQILYE
jgi:hypothetical protein